MMLALVISGEAVNDVGTPEHRVSLREPKLGSFIQKSGSLTERWPTCREDGDSWGGIILRHIGYGMSGPTALRHN
jgi:hypothetical protein